MSSTGISAFDTTLQKTHAWLKDIMVELGTEDQHLAYFALRATLHALRDRLRPEDAVHLAAQLPMLIRGFFYDGWRPFATPTHERTKLAFLQHVEQELRPTAPGASDLDVEELVRAVFKACSMHVTEGELNHLQSVLPDELRALWPA